jgi:hypothetical protein
MSPIFQRFSEGRANLEPHRIRQQQIADSTRGIDNQTVSAEDSRQIGRHRIGNWRTRKKSAYRAPLFEAYFAPKS